MAEVTRDLSRLLDWLPKMVAGIREARWEVARALADLVESGAYRQAGYEDVGQLAGDLGLSKAQVQRLVRVVRFAREMRLETELRAVDPEVADAFRRVPAEELPAVLELFTQHPLPVAWQEFHDRWGPERLRTFYVIWAARGPIRIRRVRARSEAEVEAGPEEVVIRGGVVVRGDVLEA